MAALFVCALVTVMVVASVSVTVHGESPPGVAAYDAAIRNDASAFVVSTDVMVAVADVDPDPIAVAPVWMFLITDVA